MTGTETDDSAQWAEVARRGEFSMSVLTRSCALQHGLAVRADAAMYGLLHLDNGRVQPMAFRSVESLKIFIAEMSPRSIVLEVAPDEDLRPLVAALERATGATLH